MANKAAILSYNDSERSLNLARELLSYGPFEEVVIVDNASREEEARKLDGIGEKGLTILRSGRNGGYGAGNNVALSYFKKDPPFAVLLINPDIVPTRKAVEDCLLFLTKHPEIAACSTYMKEKGKRVRNFYDIPTYSSTMLGDNHFAKKTKDEDFHEGYFTCGYVRESFSFYNYAHFAEIGFFDERFFLFDEGPSTAYRFREKGYKEAIVLDGEEVVHAHRGHKINRAMFKILKKSRSTYLREYLGVKEWKIRLYNLWWVNIFPY